MTIVASVRNRDYDLKRWIESLEGQDCREDMDICLVHFGQEGVLDWLESELPLWVVNVPYHPGPYPEWWLKNIGIREAGGEMVCCTNVDIVYDPGFFVEVLNRCEPMTLVQALRLDPQEGTASLPNGKYVSSDENAGLGTVMGHERGQPIPVMACGDCQALRREDWDKLRGYDESMVGWGGGDQDLACRALGLGMTLHVIGYEKTHHVHAWHPVDEGRKGLDAQRNGALLMKGLETASFVRNDEDWGLAPQTGSVVNARI